ncbi:hypothetical protein, partial [Pseudomonas cedrina]
PLWAEPDFPKHGFGSSVEYAAQRRADVEAPTIIRDGQRVDITKSNIVDMDDRIARYASGVGGN